MASFHRCGRDIWDLSFLDAHEVIYTHRCEGKADKVYKFIVSYSFHCFCKDYPEQSKEEKRALMYHSPKSHARSAKTVTAWRNATLKT